MIYYAKLTMHKDKEQIISLFSKYDIDKTLILMDESNIQKQEGSLYYSVKELLIKENKGLVVDSTSSLGKNNREIYKELLWLHLHRIPLVVLDIPSTINATDILKVNTVIMEVYSTLAQKEISNSKEAQQYGIENARKSNKLGRPKIGYPGNWDFLYSQWNDKKITSKGFLEKTGLKKVTFYNLLKEYQIQIKAETNRNSSLA